MVSALSAEPLSRPRSLLNRSVAPLTFKILGGEYDQRTIELKAAKVAIGAAAHCTLRLVGCGLRPVELFLLRGAGGNVVQNGAASNLLNGRAFTEARLTAGDRLSLGAIQLELLSPDGDSTPRPAENSPVAPAAEQETSDSLQLAQLQQRVAELEQEQHDDYARWQAEQQQWIEELTQARRRAIELQAELGRTASQPTGTPSEELRELEQQRDQFQSDAELLRGQLAELSTWKVRAELAEAELAAASHHQAAAEQAFQEQQHAMTLDLSNTNLKLADLQQSQQECEDLRRQLAGLASELKQAQAAVDLLKHAADEQQQELSASGDSSPPRAELEQQCAELRHEAEASQIALAEARQRITELESEEIEILEKAESEAAEAELATEQLLQWEQRACELDSREQQLQLRHDELERAAIRLQQIKKDLEERQARQRATEQAATGTSTSTSSSDNERALAELLQLRTQLDRRESELNLLEQHLTEKEASLNQREPEPSPAAPEKATPENAPEEMVCNTIVLSGQDSFAEATAQRLLNNEGEYYEEQYDCEEPAAEREDVVLHATLDYSPSEEEDPTEPTPAHTEPFEPTKTGAPVSAAEVLAKYGGGAALQNDAEEEPLSSSLPQPQAAPKPAEAEGEEALEDDDSIRQYMDQLMRRVRGESGDTTDSTYVVEPPKKAKIEQPVAPPPSPPENEDTASPAGVMSSEQYTPRSSAPEKTDNLAKMRELANSSARSALDTASRSVRAKAAVSQLVMAAGAAVAGAALIYYASSGMSYLQYGTAAMSLGAAAWWAYSAVSYAFGFKALPSRSLLDRFRRKGDAPRGKSPAEAPAKPVAAEPVAAEPSAPEQMTAEQAAPEVLDAEELV